MTCKCSTQNEVAKAKEIEQMKTNQLEQLKVDAYKWKTLYKCKFCQSFWELHYTGGRWDGEPELIKVNSDYVVENWGTQYLK
jgi:hypothetical protein